MTFLRALCAMGLVLAFAACANSASQGAVAQGDTASVASATTVATPAAPAAASTATQPRKVRMPPTGGPLPPTRYEHACKVDQDCADLERCKTASCRCIDATCIAPRSAVDPVVDPAPAPPPET
jgi:hypothetical protein